MAAYWSLVCEASFMFEFSAHTHGKEFGIYHKDSFTKTPQLPHLCPVYSLFEASFPLKIWELLIRICHKAFRLRGNHLGRTTFQIIHYCTFTSTSWENLKLLLENKGMLIVPQGKPRSKLHGALWVPWISFSSSCLQHLELWMKVTSCSYSREHAHSQRQYVPHGVTHKRIAVWCMRGRRSAMVQYPIPASRPLSCVEEFSGT